MWCVNPTSCTVFAGACPRGGRGKLAKRVSGYNLPPMNTQEQPIPLNEPMPHRKVIREWLIPLSNRVTVRAIALLIMDFAIWGAFLAGTVYFEAVWAKLLCGVAMGCTVHSSLLTLQQSA